MALGAGIAAALPAAACGTTVETWLATDSIPSMMKKVAGMKTSHSAYNAQPHHTARPFEMVFLDPFAGESETAPAAYRRDVPSSHSVSAGNRRTGSSHYKRWKRKKALEDVSRDLIALALERRLAD